MNTSSKTSSTSFEYVGDELSLFQHAVNWKKYYAGILAPYIKGDVLEVGGGIGATARTLFNPEVKSWTSVEPDADLVAIMRDSFAKEPLPLEPTLVTGTIDDVSADEKYDAVIYIDVLEHIEDDRAEVRRARGRLKKGGYLVILCPAHQWLFTPFDEAIGHFRRYSRKSMEAVAPEEGLLGERLIYLDSAGMLASMGNRLFLKASMPTIEQIKLWDSKLVPVSRWLDRCLFHRVGKSVVGIWKRV